jgi:hypothetical protein
VIRFGRHPRTEQPAREEAHPAQAPGADSWRPPRELLVRQARKDGRLVATLRTVDRGDACVVEADVYPQGSPLAIRPGPYTFPDSQRANAFVTEAVAALMYLGCDVQGE